MVGDLPTGEESQGPQTVALFVAERRQGNVSHVISLQVELLEVWQQLCHCRHGFIGHVDAVRQSEAVESVAEASPETRLGDFVASVQLQGSGARH